MTEIGKLINISPRDAWKHEAHDFTPWLSKNLEQLGDAIGLRLEPEGTKIAVGAFSADIIAKDLFGSFSDKAWPTDLRMRLHSMHQSL